MKIFQCESRCQDLSADWGWGMKIKFVEREKLSGRKRYSIIAI